MPNNSESLNAETAAADKEAESSVAVNEISRVDKLKDIFD